MNLVGQGKKVRHKVERCSLTTSMEPSTDVLFVKIVIDKTVVNQPDLKWWC